MKQKRTAAKQMLKADDGVSNVVVMMLILSVIVVAFSVFVGIYLPQMKETSEMMHSEEVKSAFLKFSSDMDSVYSRGQAGIYSEVFSLGGGDILLSSSKSAGTVEIQNEPLTTVNISYTNKTLVYNNGSRRSFDTAGRDNYSLTTINVSYTPVLPYWEDQKYRYVKGVVWVGKGGGREIPVSNNLYTVEDGNERMKHTVYSWVSRMQPELIGMNKTLYNVTFKNESNPSEGVAKSYYTCQYLYSMTLVNVSSTAAMKNYLSGSGDARLVIDAAYESDETYGDAVNPCYTAYTEYVLNTDDDGLFSRSVVVDGNPQLTLVQPSADVVNPQYILRVKYIDAKVYVE